MTLSKKKRRRIVVGDKTYFWLASGNDDAIYLCVTGEVKGCQKLLTGFDYDYSPAQYPQYGEIYASQFVVTPHVVKQVIEYALSQGWKPFEKGRDFALPIKGKIDLRFDGNRAVNEQKLWSEVSLQTTD